MTGLVAVFATIFFGCVTAGAERVEGITNTFGLIPKMDLKVLYVCTNTNHPSALESVRDAVLDWADSAREESSGPLVSDVLEACPGDFRVNFFSATRAHTYPASYPVINLGAPDDYASLLHEVGHAFGLGDGYVEGVWQCPGEQENSVMCNAGVEEISEADRDGLRAVRRQYLSRTIFAWGGKKFQCPDKMRLYGVGDWIFCAR